MSLFDRIPSYWVWRIVFGIAVATFVGIVTGVIVVAS